MADKIKPVPVPIYPVHPSLDAAWIYIESQLPITETNDLKALMMAYHNTLLAELEESK